MPLSQPRIQAPTLQGCRSLLSALAAGFMAALILAGGAIVAGFAPYRGAAE